jgi:hypothetical protein
LHLQRRRSSSCSPQHFPTIMAAREGALQQEPAAPSSPAALEVCGLLLSLSFAAWPADQEVKNQQQLDLASAPDQATTPHALQAVYEDEDVACMVSPPGIHNQARQYAEAPMLLLSSTCPPAHALGNHAAVHWSKLSPVFACADKQGRTAGRGCTAALHAAALAHSSPRSGARSRCAPLFIAAPSASGHSLLPGQALTFQALVHRHVEACWPDCYAMHWQGAQQKMAFRDVAWGTGRLCRQIMQ